MDNKSRKDTMTTSRQKYNLVFLPIISAVFFVSVPNFSKNIGIYVSLLILVNCIAGMLIIFEKFYRRNIINFIFFLIQMDLFSLFMLGMVWRLWGAMPWLAFLLVLIMLASAFIGHRYRRTILQEVISPRTKMGKMIFIVGLMGPAAASCLAYIGGKLLKGYIGLDITFKVLSLSVLPAAIYVIVVCHSISLRIQQPNWKANTKK